MATIFFDLKPSKKNKPQQKVEQLIELQKVSIEAAPAYLSYVDKNGVEHKATGGYSKKSDGSYVMSKTEINKYDVYEKTTYTYKDVETHFAYVDNSGEKRIFNELDTLMYDEETCTYTGEVTNVEYVEEEVELIAKE